MTNQPLDVSIRDVNVVNFVGSHVPEKLKWLRMERLNIVKELMKIHKEISDLEIHELVIENKNGI